MAYSEVLLDLPGRHPSMPVMHVATNHPLLEGVAGVRTVYVGFMKTDLRSMKNAYSYEKKLTCPEGGPSEWAEKGLKELLPGDYLFLRDPEVSKDPSDDVLAAMVTGEGHHGNADRAAFDRATQRVLGPKRGRNPESTAFENTTRTRKPNESRTYSIGNSVQQLRKVVAPNASLKPNHTQNAEERQTMVKDLLDSTSTLLLNVQNAFPTDCREALAADAELTGQPSGGKAGIYGTGSTQLNISSAGVSSSDRSLAGQLGEFGSAHYDAFDSPYHFTTMFSNPDIPKSYRPGAFHILQLGIFTMLEKYTGITFSGRRRHVGTAPTPPRGRKPLSSAYRLTSVHFPKASAVDGTSRFTLASLPGKTTGRGSRPHSHDHGGDALYVTPEMINKKYEEIFR